MGFLGNLLPGRGTGHYLALDIGTEVVKALVFQVDETGQKGIVTGVGRVLQRPGNMESGAVSNIDGVVVSSEEAIQAAKAQAGAKRIEKSIVGIAGELVKGTTTTVHYQRVKREVRIGVPELKMIIQKVQEKALERIKQEISYETGQEGIDINLINAAIVDVRIDGYRVSNPLNFTGGDVSMSVFNAYAPVVHLRALQTIATKLGLDLINIAAEPYAVARAVEVDDIMDFSAIFIDVGGGTTDIAVLRNGGLEGTKMFALGGRAFTKRLAKAFNLTFDKAEQLKLEYSYGKLNPADTERLDRFFEEDCRIWLSGVELSLSEFAQNDLLPPKVFLCGGGSGLPGIARALTTPAWVGQLPFAKAPQVSFLQPKDITTIEDRTGLLNNPQDITPIGLCNLALQITSEEKMMAGILRRTVETIQSET